MIHIFEQNDRCGKLDSSLNSRSIDTYLMAHKLWVRLEAGNSYELKTAQKLIFPV